MGKIFVPILLATALCACAGTGQPPFGETVQNIAFEWPGLSLKADVMTDLDDEHYIVSGTLRNSGKDDLQALIGVDLKNLSNVGDNEPGTMIAEDGLSSNPSFGTGLLFAPFRRKINVFAGNSAEFTHKWKRDGNVIGTVLIQPLVKGNDWMMDGNNPVPIPLARSVLGEAY